MLRRAIITHSVVSLSILGSILVSGAAAADEPRSITQLPGDLAHLATVWVAIPRTMYDVSAEDGPVQGLTVGAVSGSGHMVYDAVTYLTSGYHQPARPNERRPAGALLHYAF